MMILESVNYEVHWITEQGHHHVSFGDAPWEHEQREKLMLHLNRGGVFLIEQVKITTRTERLVPLTDSAVIAEKLAMRARGRALAFERELSACRQEKEASEAALKTAEQSAQDWERLHGIEKEAGQQAVSHFTKLVERLERERDEARKQVSDNSR